MPPGHPCHRFDFATGTRTAPTSALYRAHHSIASKNIRLLADRLHRRHAPRHQPWSMRVSAPPSTCRDLPPRRTGPVLLLADSILEA
eukprot:scaffold1885_cov402-Prasinococcus_capsulatus_cf.AAC.19